MKWDDGWRIRSIRPSFPGKGLIDGADVGSAEHGMPVLIRRSHAAGGVAVLLLLFRGRQGGFRPYRFRFAGVIHPGVPLRSGERHLSGHGGQRCRGSLRPSSGPSIKAEEPSTSSQTASKSSPPCRMRFTSLPLFQTYAHCLHYSGFLPVRQPVEKQKRGRIYRSK